MSRKLAGPRGGVAKILSGGEELFVTTIVMSCALSSVVEQCFYTAKVRGSNPLARTKLFSEGSNAIVPRHMAVKISPVDMEARKTLDLRPGDTVRVWQKIEEEKGKYRLQAFEGLV